MEIPHGRPIKKQRDLQNNIRNTDCSTNDEAKVVKWDRKNDQAHGLIGMSISPDLIIHLDGLDSLVEAWEKLNTVFGLKNEIQTYQLENELHILYPSNFPYIED
jgi:hypothetical protein